MSINRIFSVRPVSNNKVVLISPYSVAPKNLKSLAEIALPPTWLKFGIGLGSLSIAKRVQFLTKEERLGGINLVLLDKKGHHFKMIEDNGTLKPLIGMGSTVYGALLDLMEKAQKSSHL